MSTEAFARLKRWENWFDKTYGDDYTTEQFNEMMNRWKAGKEPPQD